MTNWKNNTVYIFHGFSSSGMKLRPLWPPYDEIHITSWEVKPGFSWKNAKKGTPLLLTKNPLEGTFAPTVQLATPFDILQTRKNEQTPTD